MVLFGEESVCSLIGWVERICEWCVRSSVGRVGGEDV